jgi:hypothetical protein
MEIGIKSEYANLLKRWKELKGVLVIALASMQFGCVTSQPQVDEPPPANYREIIAKYIRENFLDPYSVRDASIAPPKAGQLSRSDAIAVERGWIVCFRANAKSRAGGYTGLKTTAFLVRGVGVVTSHTGDDHYEVRTSCANAAYESFREVEMAAEQPGTRRTR